MFTPKILPLLLKYFSRLLFYCEKLRVLMVPGQNWKHYFTLKVDYMCVDIHVVSRKKCFE